MGREEVYANRSALGKKFGRKVASSVLPSFRCLHFRHYEPLELFVLFYCFVIHAILQVPRAAVMVIFVEPAPNPLGRIGIVFVFAFSVEFVLLCRISILTDDNTW